MNIGHKDFVITLDWDNITWSEFGFRINWITDKYGKNIETIRFRTSATKGFHVRIVWKISVDVLRMRQHLKDDGKRIVGDIFRQKEHDILWQEKIYGQILFNAGAWITLFDSNIKFKTTPKYSKLTTT